MRFGIALDLGTSGFRAQAIDLDVKKVVSTAITLRHPLPGSNIMDHLSFAIEYGQDLAHAIVTDAVEKLLEKLDIELKDVERIAISGNPTQLSVFQGIEVRDLAWAGERALHSRGIVPPARDATIKKSGDVGLSNISPYTDVFIPPCIKHELGADAVAMMVKSGFLDEKLAMVTDYGTNAEMALKVDDMILTGSAAAGPAIEGQHIDKGMLASPGAISDLSYSFTGWKNIVLDEDMYARPGDVVDISTGKIIDRGEMHGRARGITGTGVIAAIAVGMVRGIVKNSKIQTYDKKIHLQDEIYLIEKDIEEAGKALGAFRAGFLTLVEEAGIKFSDLKTMYMAGASGFYVDPLKARIIGEIPPASEKIYQVGNTSLSLAVDLVMRPDYLDDLQDFVDDLRSNHVMFATSDIFQNVYILELAVWTEGMSLERYNIFLKKYGIDQEITGSLKSPNVIKVVPRDIKDIGEKGLRVVPDVGTIIEIDVTGCKNCKKCVHACPENAILSVDENKTKISSSMCLGTACRRCVLACPEKVLKFENARVLGIER
ncbi:MAG TPA: methylamine methyltransferase corrinoid protein reductive activase [Halobacteria archaeon]|nr:methylamine methyltransferase corrinoid protein reductive activase [Halobacteria archaeon]